MHIHTNTHRPIHLIFIFHNFTCTLKQPKKKKKKEENAENVGTQQKISQPDLTEEKVAEVIQKCLSVF